MTGAIRTPMYPWETLRALTAEDGAAAASLTTGYTFNEKQTSCVDLYTLFGDRFAAVLIAMYGGTIGANDVVGGTDKFGFDLIGYRAPQGDTVGVFANPALLICSCADQAAEVGTMEMSPDGGTTKSSRWVDEMTLTNTDWPGTLNKFDAGNNRVCVLAFDASGIRYIYPYVFGANGGVAGEAPGVGMIVTVY